MRIDENISGILQKIEASGYEVYLVGGCVRDYLMGIPVNDYDIASSAEPTEIERILNGMKIIETGIRHGTVTVINNGVSAEITTFRVDGKYTDNRRPDEVTFSNSIEEDLKRRDFTVNAMAYNPQKGLIDNFGGQYDLEHGILRCVGEPEKRFNEDALRIMRALRLASSLGFRIEHKTASAMNSSKHLIKNISAERTASELNKFICGDCEKLILEFSSILAEIIPEIAVCDGFKQHSKYHNRDVLAHIAASVKAIRPEKHLRLAMLFHDLGKPECYVYRDGAGHFKGHQEASAHIAERTMKELKYDNNTLKKVLFLVRNHDLKLQDDPAEIKKLLRFFGKEALLDLIDVHIADDKAKNTDYQNRIEEYLKVKKTVEKIISENQCFSLAQLAVNGNDLLNLGLTGKKIKITLEKMLDGVIEGKYANNKDILLKCINEQKEGLV